MIFIKNAIFLHKKLKLFFFLYFLGYEDDFWRNMDGILRGKPFGFVLVAVSSKLPAPVTKWVGYTVSNNFLYCILVKLNRSQVRMLLKIPIIGYYRIIVWFISFQKVQISIFNSVLLT